MDLAKLAEAFGLEGSVDSELARIEHLKLIQAIIARMARTAFAVKAGSSTLVAALITLAITADSSPVAAFGILPLALLWFLDAYYLREERSFRRLYDIIRTSKPAEPGSEHYFRMTKGQGKGGLGEFIKTIFSTSLLVFYLAELFILGLVAAVVAG